MADRLAAATSMPRGVIELVNGATFLTITALVLHVLMRRADRLDVAAARRHRDGHRLAVGATPGLLNSGVQDGAFNRDLWETILAGQVLAGQLFNRCSDGQLDTVSENIYS